MIEFGTCKITRRQEYAGLSFHGDKGHSADARCPEKAVGFGACLRVTV